MIKLNLGCRNNILEGYVNIDLDELFIQLEDPDLRNKNTPETTILQMNIFDIDKFFAMNSVDKIVASHFMEHFTDSEVKYILYKLWGLLKPGGELIITTPDFYAIINHWKKKHEKGDFTDLDLFHIKVFNDQYETFHKTIWYEEIGRFYLLREGFFRVDSIEFPSEIEVRFNAVKI